MSIRTHELRDTRTHKRISIACALVSALGGCAWIFLAVLFAVAALRPSPALAAPGDLVPGFGTGGIATSNPSTTHDGAQAIAIDNSALYVLGAQSGNYSYNTGYLRLEKRDLNTGNAIWIQTDTTKYFHYHSSIAIDSTGVYAGLCNVDVVSGSWRLEKRNLNDGNPIWTQTGTNASSSLYYLLDIAVDSTGLYVVGNYADATGRHWRIQKRSLNDGNVIWTQASIFDNGTTSIANAVSVDSTGIYIAGYRGYSSGETSWRIEKRSLNDGSLIWQQAWDEGTFGSGEVAIALAIDSTAMYVGGYYYWFADTQWHLQKRNLTDGSLIWKQDIGTSNVTSTTGIALSPITGASDFTKVITADSTGIYIVGYNTSASNKKRWRIEKRDLTIGSLISGTVTNDPSIDDDMSRAVVIDGLVMYIAGYDQTNGASNTQWRIEKRESGGSPPPPPPTVNLSAFPATINSGESSTLSWTTTDATSCDDVPLPEWISGPVGVAGSEVEWPTATTTYTISCTGPGGTTQQSATVTVTAPACAPGDIVWSIDSNPPATWNGKEAYDIAVDNTGVYIVGYYDGTLKGRIEKRDLDNGNLITSIDDNDLRFMDAIDVDSTGLYVGGDGTTRDLAKRNLNDLSPIWNSIADGIVRELVVDGTGIYTGESFWDWHAYKRNLNNGSQIWYQSSGESNGRILGIAIDSTGVYIVGDYNSPLAGIDYKNHLEKRNLTNGGVIWSQELSVSDGPAGVDSNSVAVDSTGVYVSYTMYNGSYTPYLEKRNLTDGSLIWTTNNLPYYGYEDIGIDSTGLYGVSFNIIEKRSLTDGSLIWTKTISNMNAARGIDIDNTGIYIAGYYTDYDSIYVWRIEKRILSCGGAPPPPTIDLFTATPSTINSGEPSTLDWSTTGAASCTGLSPAEWITEGGGGGACSGTTSPFTGGCQVVQPVATTDYIIECYNAVGDPAQQTVRVTVNAPPAGADCGLRVYDGTTTVTLDCESPASTTSLRIYKNGATSGIKLVDPADPNASRIRIQTHDGVKALRRQ